MIPFEFNLVHMHTSDWYANDCVCEGLGMFGTGTREEANYVITGRMMCSRKAKERDLMLVADGDETSSQSLYEEKTSQRPFSF